MLAYVLHVGKSGPGYGSKNKLGGRSFRVCVLSHTRLNRTLNSLKNIKIGNSDDVQ